MTRQIISILSNRKKMTCSALSLGFGNDSTSNRTFILSSCWLGSMTMLYYNCMIQVVRRAINVMELPCTVMCINTQIALITSINDAVSHCEYSGDSNNKEKIGSFSQDTAKPGYLI